MCGLPPFASEMDWINEGYRPRMSLNCWALILSGLMMASLPIAVLHTRGVSKKWRTNNRLWRRDGRWTCQWLLSTLTRITGSISESC